MDASTLRFIMELADLLGKVPCIPVPAELGKYPVEQASIISSIDNELELYSERI